MLSSSAEAAAPKALILPLSILKLKADAFLSIMVVKHGIISERRRSVILIARVGIDVIVGLAFEFLQDFARKLALIGGLWWNNLQILGVEKGFV